MESKGVPSEAQRKAQGNEIANYIDSCYNYEKENKLEDVYITDHKPVPKKYLTNNEEEDQDFYEY